MTDSILQRALQDSTEDVLEKMFFIHCLEEPQEFQSEPEFVAHLTFEGDPSGALTLAVRASAARSVAADFLAAEEKDLSEQEIGEVIGELANMICGSVLSRVENSATFRLASPRIVLSGKAATNFAAEPEGSPPAGAPAAGAPPAGPLPDGSPPVGALPGTVPPPTAPPSAGSPSAGSPPIRALPVGALPGTVPPPTAPPSAGSPSAGPPPTTTPPPTAPPPNAGASAVHTVEIGSGRMVVSIDTEITEWSTTARYAF